MDEINLKGKMDNWGPYGKNEGKWLIFTVGNPNEGHGLALPRMNRYISILIFQNQFYESIYCNLNNLFC